MQSSFEILPFLTWHLLTHACVRHTSKYLLLPLCSGCTHGALNLCFACIAALPVRMLPLQCLCVGCCSVNLCHVPGLLCCSLCAWSRQLCAVSWLLQLCTSMPVL